MFWLAQNGDEKSHALTVPTIVERIIDLWADMLSDRPSAQRCWATLHGHIVLGSDNDMVMQAIREMVGRGQSTTSSPAHSSVAQPASNVPPQHETIFTPPAAPVVQPQPQPQAEVQSQTSGSDDVVLL